METNSIEGIARDGIHTATQVARAAVQSGSEFASEVATATSKLARDTTQTTEESSLVILGAVGRVIGAARQVGEQAIGLTRTVLDGAIEVAGTVTRAAVRVTADVAIEVVHSVRAAASALLAAPADYESSKPHAIRKTNGGAAELVA
jgi:hypothetical protein